MGSTYWPYIVIVILLAFSAFFSGSEIAYTSANKMRLKKAAEGEDVRARLAFYIYENYNKALATILIGNNAVKIAASSMATVIAINVFGDKGTLFAIVVMAVLILIFGEIMPKNLARVNCDSFAPRVSVPLRFFMVVTAPIVYPVMGFVGIASRLWSGRDGGGAAMTEEVLALIIETVEDEGVINEDRGELLQSALDFSEITAQEITTPRVDMLAIDINDKKEVIAQIIEDSPHSRIPVYSGGIDNVIGVLYANHYFVKAIDDPEVDIRSILIDVCYIPKTMKLPAVLAELKRHRMHLAIVVDEYGGTLGLITMEDVLEELVGEIWDESDEIISDFEKIGENTYVVRGYLGIYEFFERLELDEALFEGEFTTVGGWAIEMLDRFPQEGDSFGFQHFIVTVREIREKRIISLTVEVMP